MLALLLELHGDRGCMLLLEDLHWADADTLGLVAYLADAVPGALSGCDLYPRGDRQTVR